MALDLKALNDRIEIEELLVRYSRAIAVVVAAVPGGILLKLGGDTLGPQLTVGLAGIVMVTLEDPRVLPNESFSVAVFASLTWLAGVVLCQRSLRLALVEERSGRGASREHGFVRGLVADR